jgi:uncharacterized protein (DUF1697 family)
MTVYIALLRGINVGGSGLLAMKDLVALCGKCGFAKARTYIQSGNVVFESDLKEEGVRQALEKALAAKMGKPVDVMVRRAAEMRAVLEANPFPDTEPNKKMVVFLTGKAPVEALRGVTGPAGEQVRAGKREVYVYYPEGQGRSKLKLPLKVAGTARNINTVAKLVAMAES